MTDSISSIHEQTERQVAHWSSAASRLSLDDLAAPAAWSQLERYLDVSIRHHLNGVIGRLRADADALLALHRAADSPAALAEVNRKLLVFRLQFMRTETTLDYFADAINTRTSTSTGALLRACDTLAYRSMAQLLDQFNLPTPVVLTYIDKGLGAAILKAGLRLWDGGDASPVAVIKIVRHNLLRPTALIHEAGHQVAHVLGWNEELAAVLSKGLVSAPAGIAEAWAGWASEIAADAFAFVHTGYASVSALHDVLAGDDSFVFRYLPGDPHPLSFLRVLLGVEMCRYFYGAGPWDALSRSWQAIHPVSRASSFTRRLVEESLPLLPLMVRLILDTPTAALRDRPLRSWIRPERVSPQALDELAGRLGPALYTSAHWLWSEPLRILALTGLRLSAHPRDLQAILQLQEQTMLRLGGALSAA